MRAFGAAIEDLNAKFGLKSLDSPRQRWLADTEAFCGSPHMLLLCDDDKGFQIDQRHVLSIRVKMMNCQL